MFSEKIKGIKFEDIWSQLGESEKQVCCTRSFEKNGWENFIAWNPAAVFTAYKEEGIEKIQQDLKEFIREEQKKNHKIFGYISYDLGYALHGIKSHARNDLNLPDVLFYSFASWVVVDVNGIEFITETKEKNTEPKAKLKASMSREAYKVGYEKIKKYIVEGDAYQMNFTHRLEGQTKKNPRQLFMGMCEKNKVDYCAYIEGDGFEILSASPERFIKISTYKKSDKKIHRTIDTFPIKGTRPRGDNKKEDEKNKKDLLHSEKEAAELNMITDLLRNDLGKVCEIGSVKVVGSRIPHAYTTVWHTYSHITGKLLREISSIEALLSMFPGGSITGCPKKRAMEIIDEVEPVMRGVYTGCIGFMNPDDSCDFNISIRTLIKKKEKVYLQVGGGIVHDSKEKDEYGETFNKAKSFLGIL
jgi:anthranilate/para-aminobenzoate synthase component I